MNVDRPVGPVARTQRETATQGCGFAVDVLLLLIRGGSVLLTRRAGNIPGAGTWALPSGKVEPDESVVAAVRREAEEELRISIGPEQVVWQSVAHVRPPDGAGRVGFAFAVREWEGEPQIAEPEKCSALMWCPLTEVGQLHPVHAYTQVVMRMFVGGERFAAWGW